MSLHDDLLKHRIFLQRMTKDTAKPMYTAIKKTVKLAKKELDKSKNIQYNKLGRKLLRLSTEGLAPTLDKLRALAEYEIRFVNKLLKKYNIEKISKLPEIDKLLSVPMSLGLQSKNKTIEKAYTEYINTKTRIITEEIESQKPKEEKISSLNLLLSGILVHQLLSLTNTSLNSIASSIHREIFKGAGIEVVQWIAILDNSVCDYCEGLHNQVFKIDDLPDWPAHTKCRCEVVPYYEV